MGLFFHEHLLARSLPLLLRHDSEVIHPFLFLFAFFDFHFGCPAFLFVVAAVKLLNTNAALPEVELAAYRTTLATQAGHMGYAAPFFRGCSFVFSKYSARRSSDPSQNLRYSSTHCAACFNGLASNCIS